MLFKDDCLKSEFDFGSVMDNRLYSINELEEAIYNTKYSLENMSDKKGLIIQLSYPLGNVKAVSHKRIKMNDGDKNHSDINIHDQITNPGKGYLKDVLKRINIFEPSVDDVLNYNLYLKCLYFIFFTKYYIADGVGFLDLFIENKGLLSYDSIENPQNYKYISFLLANMESELNKNTYFMEQFNFSYLSWFHASFIRTIADIIGSGNTEKQKDAWDMCSEDFLYSKKTGSLYYYLEMIVSSLDKTYRCQEEGVEYNNIVYLSVNYINNKIVKAKYDDIKKFITVLRSYNDTKSNTVLSTLIFDVDTSGEIKLTKKELENTLYSGELLDLCFPELKTRKSKKKHMEEYNLLTIMKYVLATDFIQELIKFKLSLLVLLPERTSILSIRENEVFISKKFIYAVVSIITSIPKEAYYESLNFDISLSRNGVKKIRKYRFINLYRKPSKKEIENFLHSMGYICFVIIMFYAFWRMLKVEDEDGEMEAFISSFKEKYSYEISKIKQVIPEQLYSHKDGVLKRTLLVMEILKKLSIDFDIDLELYYDKELVEKLLK